MSFYLLGFLFRHQDGHFSYVVWACSRIKVWTLLMESKQDVQGHLVLSESFLTMVVIQFQQVHIFLVFSYHLKHFVSFV